MSYLNLAKGMYGKILGGPMLEAFEEYYHDDVIMVEATGEVRKGKAANREFEEEWVAGVAKVHDGGIVSMTSNEETGHTAVEVWMDVEFKNGQRYKMEEVAVQKWKGDKIIHERFYYNMPGQ